MSELGARRCDWTRRLRLEPVRDGGTLIGVAVACQHGHGHQRARYWAFELRGRGPEALPGRIRHRRRPSRPNIHYIYRLLYINIVQQKDYISAI